MSMDSELPDIKESSGALCGNMRVRKLVEVLVFLFLIVPSLVLSFFAVRKGGLSFVFTATSVTLRDLSLVSLVVYFLWSGGEQLESLGLKFKNVRREIAIGIGLFLPMLFGAALLDHLLQSMGMSSPKVALPSFLTFKGTADLIFAFVLVVVVAFAEEIIFRGYLLLRFRGLNLSPLLAALLSSAIFSLGHGYEGGSGVVTVGAMGFVLACVYIWRQSLVAPIVMHFLQDFTGIILVPLLGPK
jgi:membrane protease YdiL (CAAX protease family)